MSARIAGETDSGSTISPLKARPELSIVLPARNEAAGLSRLLPALRERFPAAEILVVDDGSTDTTGDCCETHEVRCLCHPYGMGNGAAVKSGARAARGEVLVFMDADGQHRAADVARLLGRLAEGYDMVVGARSGSHHAGWGRRLANAAYNRLASYMTGQPVADLTSGFRAVRARRFREFLSLLPNGFSYPTTITMAFFRSGYGVAYEPVTVERRIGRSHIQPLRDGMRFLLIIFKIGSLYSPLKIFLPISSVFFTTGLSYYAYTFSTAGRFTNMSALLFTTAVLVFLIGLVSEQITSLIYRPTP